MKSFHNGKNILTNNAITAITHLGFYLLVESKEYFIPFTDYPVFKQASVDEIYDFKMLSPRQIYWKKLDCDIELEALEYPEKFVLTFNISNHNKKKRLTVKTDVS